MVGDQVLGVLAVSFATDRAFPDAERRFALTLVAQAAQAFERAALTDARWRVAQILQRRLLPAALPDVARLAVAVHYEQAGRHTQAGGDWYDVIALDDDQVAIVVGDVVGSGPAAAAVIGQLRSALGFLLRIGHLPATALSWLSRYARDVPGAVGSTAVCTVLHTGTGELRWAAAGHPPPLLQPGGRRPGAVQFLEDGHGIVLGIHDDPPYIEATTVLAAGSSVLIYTDGVVERRGEVIDDGLDRLAATAAAHPDTDPATLLCTVLGAAFDTSWARSECYSQALSPRWPERTSIPGHENYRPGAQACRRPALPVPTIEDPSAGTPR